MAPLRRHYDYKEPYESMDDFWLVTHIVRPSAGGCPCCARPCVCCRLTCAAVLATHPCARSTVLVSAKPLGWVYSQCFPDSLLHPSPAQRRPLQVFVLSAYSSIRVRRSAIAAPAALLDQALRHPALDSPIPVRAGAGAHRGRCTHLGQRCGGALRRTGDHLRSIVTTPRPGGARRSRRKRFRSSSSTCAAH
jgi:hypothetical protein